MLETERVYYAENVDEWKRRFPEKFVVVKDRELIGAFSSTEEALSAGAERFGLDSFLVRLVGESEKEVNIPALTLGLLSANPPHSDHCSEAST
jgi:hypothetical protein